MEKNFLLSKEFTFPMKLDHLLMSIELLLFHSIYVATVSDILDVILPVQMYHSISKQQSQIDSIHPRKLTRFLFVVVVVAVVVVAAARRGTIAGFSSASSSSEPSSLRIIAI